MIVELDSLGKFLLISWMNECDQTGTCLGTTKTDKYIPKPVQTILLHVFNP